MTLSFQVSIWEDPACWDDIMHSLSPEEVDLGVDVSLSSAVWLVSVLLSVHLATAMVCETRPGSYPEESQAGMV